MFNLLVTSFIFVCAAHEINVVTSILLPYIVPPEADKKRMLRNVALFAIVMIPIAARDGMI
jgi:hypothetical protein